MRDLGTLDRAILVAVVATHGPVSAEDARWLCEQGVVHEFSLVDTKAALRRLVREGFVTREGDLYSSAPESEKQS